MALREGQDFLMKRKLACPRRESNPGWSSTLQNLYKGWHIFLAPSLFLLLLSRLLHNKTIICNIFFNTNLRFICLLFGAFARGKHLIVSSRLSVCLSVRPSVCSHDTSLFPLEGFSSSLVLGSFIQICIENSRLVKIRHRQQYVIWTGMSLNYVSPETHKQFCNWGGICSLWGAKWGWKIRLSIGQLL
jgi:hypothetical protein